MLTFSMLICSPQTTQLSRITPCLILFAMHVHVRIHLGYYHHNHVVMSSMIPYIATYVHTSKSHVGG